MANNPPLSARMLLAVLVTVCSLALAVTGQPGDDDWIDPYDMLNYDASTKTMRKPAEPAEYPNVPTKRRQYENHGQQSSCDKQVVELQKEIEEQKKKIKLLSEQPTCNPVFKRFLTRLLKEIHKVGAPSDYTDVYYDAKVKLSKQALTEIQTLLDGEDSWRTGALDNAVSQILVDLRPLDYEAWMWRFEDTFGIDLDTLLKMGMFVLIIVAIICTELWSTVSWFMQFKRLFAVCFFVSIIWNWFYLYKIAFAQHQSNMVQMDGFNDKCTGVKKIDWTDSLKEWFRSTWTLQDDPCKKYYEVLMVNPILLVPPTKAISVTITTFITEPLKHFGQGISEFLRALLKDLPLTLQIPVLLTIVIAIMICMYGSVQAAFQHGITAPFRRPRRDRRALQQQQQQQQLQQPHQQQQQQQQQQQPQHQQQLQQPQHQQQLQQPQHQQQQQQPQPPQMQQPHQLQQPPQPQYHHPGVQAPNHLAGGDAPQHAQRHQRNNVQLDRNQVRQRRPNNPKIKPAMLNVETLRTAEARYSGDETDARLREEEPDLYTASDSENEQEAQEEPSGACAPNTAQSKTKSTKSDLSQSKAKAKKENPSTDAVSRDGGAAESQSAERRPSQANVPEPQASAEDNASSNSLSHFENFGVPVQESSPVFPDVLRAQE